MSGDILFTHHFIDHEKVIGEFSKIPDGYGVAYIRVPLEIGRHLKNYSQVFEPEKVREMVKESKVVTYPIELISKVREIVKDDIRALI